MATTIAKPELLVGKRLRRREDPRLITGTATYVDDIKMPGMLYAALVRSARNTTRSRNGTDCRRARRVSPPRTQGVAATGRPGFASVGFFCKEVANSEA